MAVVWEHDAITVRDGFAHLNARASRQRTYTTFMTVMRRLAANGMLACRPAVVPRGVRGGPFDSRRLLACDDSFYAPDCVLRLAGLERGWRTTSPAREQGLEYRDQLPMVQVVAHAARRAARMTRLSGARSPGARAGRRSRFDA